MKVNALLMDEKDNVVTCVEDVPAGESVVYKRGGEECSLTAAELIPACHKAALTDIPAGGDVRKYGELIGRADAPIAKGCWVSHNNITSVPRDYASEYILGRK